MNKEGGMVLQAAGSQVFTDFDPDSIEKVGRFFTKFCRTDSLLILENR